MQHTFIGRLVVPAAVALGLLVAACGQTSTPVPTTAPAKPTEAPKPTAAATGVASPAAKPATSPAAAPAPSPAGSAISIAGPYPGEANTLNGAGATFPAPLYTKWFEEYNKLTNVKVNYQAIGSGGGIKGITDKTVDFAGSDAPMTDEQLKAAKGQIFHIPSALGAIVLIHNIPNVNAKLKFTGDTIAGIFMGDITKWNDPKLVADNPDLANVNQDIVVVHRSDGSGTTFGFTDYLSKVNATWKQKVGNSTSVNWPVGLGGSGNPGVAGEVKQSPYSIGYVELIYAVQNKLSYAQVKNKAGRFIDPSLDSVTAAAASAAQTIPSDLRFSIVDAPGDTAYPICTATWLLAYKDMDDQAKGIALTRLLWWATHDAQRLNKDLEYATVPTQIAARSEEFIRQISVGGKSVFPGR